MIITIGVFTQDQQLCGSVGAQLCMHANALLHLFVSASACVCTRGQRSSSSFPCPASRHPQYPSANTKAPFLRRAYVPRCTAEDVSTHNTPGNDPFAMATTNKEKFHQCGQEGVRRVDAERERELAGSQECQTFWPPLHPDKGL